MLNKSNKKSKRRVKDKFKEERQTRIIPLHPKSENQRKALRSFNNNVITVLSGSAGSGKTELMSWYASKLWLEGKVDNIVITRPHQQLGNDYGAVKGGDTEKLLPFCMSMLLKFKKYLGTNVLKNNFREINSDSLFFDVSGISIVPTEKIQGMSFGKGTIILADEQQCSTPAQMKALVTRIEDGGQLIIAGDKAQSPLKGENGLQVLEELIAKYPHKDIEVIKFTTKDNCRSGVSGHMANIFEKGGGW